MNETLLSETVLFQGCSKDDLSLMAQHLDFKEAHFKKGALIFHAGTRIQNIGVVLSGSVRIEHHDLWGKQMVLDVVKSGGIFAEAYACLKDETMPLDIYAQENCAVLWINADQLLSHCPYCSGQSRLIQNLLLLGARKNIQLSKRSMHTSSKTIRGRLFSYFSQLISEQGSRKIVTPLNRQQLADYLNLDRSALSKELGKMEKAGLLRYHKNHFEILTDLDFHDEQAS